MTKSERAEMYRSYLAEEGYAPKIDDDGDVRFKYEGGIGEGSLRFGRMPDWYQEQHGFQPSALRPKTYTLYSNHDALAAAGERNARVMAEGRARGAQGSADLHARRRQNIFHATGRDPGPGRSLPALQPLRSEAPAQTQPRQAPAAPLTQSGGGIAGAPLTRSGGGIAGAPLTRYEMDQRFPKARLSQRVKPLSAPQGGAMAPFTAEAASLQSVYEGLSDADKAYAQQLARTPGVSMQDWLRRR